MNSIPRPGSTNPSDRSQWSIAGLNWTTISHLQQVYDYLEKSSKDSHPDDKAAHCALSSIVYPLFRSSSTDVKYLLFTPNNPNEACDLQPNEEALQKCYFNPDARTVVLVHGFIGGMSDYNLNFFVKDELLETGEYNVVVLNWTYYTNTDIPAILSYPADSLVTFYIGLRLSSWMTFLQKNAGARPEMFHLNGHSLGAHVVSTAGKSTCNLGGITFMDAAGPLFRFLPDFLNPIYTDALITQAIHTSAAYTLFGGYGLEKPYAHVDYYPNGGNDQPKCYNGATYRDTNDGLNKVDSYFSKISCNHDSAYIYYLASFKKDCHFLGLICDSYEDYESGKCNSRNSDICEMNFDLKINPNLPPESKCFLNTSAKYPFCLN